MELIAYPGFSRMTQAEYGVAKRPGLGGPEADIVVINSVRAGLDGTSLWNSEIGRDLVLNTILERDLAGWRLDRIHYFVLVDSALTQRMHAVQLPLEPADLTARLVCRADWGRYRARFDLLRHLSAEEIRLVCTSVGFQRDPSLPAWLDGILLGGPFSALNEGIG